MHRPILMTFATLLWSATAAYGADLGGLAAKRAGLAAVVDDSGRIYAIGGDLATDGPTMEVLDVNGLTWHQVAAPPAKLFTAGAAYVNGKIFLIGGELGSPSSDQYAPNVAVYDVATNLWSTGGPIQAPRSGVAGAALGGKVYAVGGTGVIFGGNPAPAHIPDPNGGNFLDAFGVRITEAYDPATGVSQLLSPAPHRRSGGAAVGARDGKLYAIGGWFEGDFYGYPDFQTEVGVTYENGMVEALDPATGKWQSVALMRTPRSGLAAVQAADGLIYTFGGTGDDGAPSAVVEALNPATGQWLVKAPMPTARTGVAAVSAKDGRVYVLGGSSTALGTTSIVEVYDPATDKWLTSHDKEPGEDFTFDSLAALFDGADAVTADAAGIVGWRSGRCYSYDQKTVPLGGLLVGYQSGAGVKVTTFEYDGAEPDFFDTLTADKRTQILQAVDSQDQHLADAKVVDGHYLGSLYSYTNDAGDIRTFEYQAKRTRDWYLSRVVAVTAAGDLPAGGTKEVCFHRPAPL